MNIYVGNLPYSVNDDELRALFAKDNQRSVDKASVIMDRDTGRSKGFGFVEMSNDAEAKEAIEELNGHSMNGRELKVNEARPRDSKPKRSNYRDNNYA